MGEKFRSAVWRLDRQSEANDPSWEHYDPASQRSNPAAAACVRPNAALRMPGGWLLRGRGASRCKVWFVCRVRGEPRVDPKFSRTSSEVKRQSSRRFRWSADRPTGLIMRIRFRRVGRTLYFKKMCTNLEASIKIWIRCDSLFIRR